MKFSFGQSICHSLNGEVNTVAGPLPVSGATTPTLSLPSVVKYNIRPFRGESATSLIFCIRKDPLTSLALGSTMPVLGVESSAAYVFIISPSTNRSIMLLPLLPQKVLYTFGIVLLEILV